MTQRILFLLSLLLLAAAPVSPERDLQGMSWLAGTWSGDKWGGRFVAYYTTPEGGRILSHSELRNGETVGFHEFEVFLIRDGEVRMQPYPKGRPVTGFTLSELDGEARRAVFENPDKDFPTRITYHREADDVLTIVLDDPHGESDEVERFDLERHAD